jgi:RNA polymerase sigma-70 factor (ECF subfamily)
MGRMVGPLSTVFHGAYKGRCTLADLEARLDAIVRRGRVAWPRLALAPSVLVRQLAERLPAAASSDEVSALLDGIHAAELHLACACAARLPGAAEALELHFMARVPGFVRHVNGGAGFAADVQQTLRVYLLVAGPGARPHIGDYSGMRSLARWLRLLAVRVALERARPWPQALSDDGPAVARALIDEPDLDAEVARAHHRALFQRALDEALADLTAQERELLRLQIVEEMDLDALAERHGVHRATCARWLVAARDKLHEDTRRRVIAALPLSPSEFDSLAELIQGGLSITFAAGDVKPLLARQTLPQ